MSEQDTDGGVQRLNLTSALLGQLPGDGTTVWRPQRDRHV